MTIQKNKRNKDKKWGRCSDRIVTTYNCTNIKWNWTPCTQFAHTHRGPLSHLWAHAPSLSLRHAYLRILTSAQWFDLVWFAKPPHPPPSISSLSVHFVSLSSPRRSHWLSSHLHQSMHQYCMHGWSCGRWRFSYYVITGLGMFTHYFNPSLPYMINS